MLCLPSPPLTLLCPCLASCRQAWYWSLIVHIASLHATSWACCSSWSLWGRCSSRSDRCHVCLDLPSLFCCVISAVAWPGVFYPYKQCPAAIPSFGYDCLWDLCHCCPFRLKVAHFRSSGCSGVLWRGPFLAPCRDADHSSPCSSRTYHCFRSAPPGPR